MAKSVFTTDGKGNILQDGKVVAKAKNEKVAAQQASQQAATAGGTYSAYSVTPTKTTAPVTTPVKTTPTSAIPGLNTAGLAEAAARRAANTANATDLANLKYAEGKGWKADAVAVPVAAAVPTPTPAPKAATTLAGGPPTGATLVSSPSALTGLSEAQLWRDPNSNKIYKLADAAPAAAAPSPLTPQTPAATPPAAATPTTGLNTSGLLEAYARKTAGTANAIDLANLDYAMGKGWTPPAASQQAPAASATSTGAQDIPGLNTSGLNEAYARKVAGTANATDLANLSYAESKGWKANGDASSVITDANEANDIINSEQDADIAAKTTDDGPQTRKTTEEIMAEIKTAITPKTDAPEAPKYEEALTGLRTEYGISALETSLNSLQTERAQLSAEYQKLFGDERAKTVAMGVIGGRISEEERTMNERLAVIDNGITSVTNQLNTKLNVVNSLMDAKKLDYTTATQAYEAEMTQNISLFNAAQGIEDSLKTDEQRVIDNARASAQIMVNGFTAAGLTYSELSPAQQTTLKQLSLQSGFGAGFYETLIAVSAEVQKDVLTSVISDDKTMATIIYKDGTTTTIPTGQTAAHNTPVGGSGGGGSSTSTEDKAYKSFLNDAADLIEKLDSGDISWSTAWDQLHIKYPDASAELIDEKLGGGKAQSRSDLYGNIVKTDAHGNQVDVNEQDYYGRGTKVAK